MIIVFDQFGGLGMGRSHDVFIAYSQRDRDKAIAFARSLEALGLTIWWDVSLTPGDSWVDEIGNNIRSAKIVLVLWSNASSNSQWVRREADLGRQLGKLVQVRLDDTVVPEPFSMDQLLDFGDWHEGTIDPRFEMLLERICQMGGIKLSTTRSIRSGREDEDAIAWAAIQNSTDRSDFLNFISHNPHSRFVNEARRRLSISGPNAASGKVFLSYRRDDSKATARLIYENLKQKMSPNDIFFDIDSIPYGVTFRQYIQEKLLECNTLIAIIGSNWRGRHGLRGCRINQPGDFVRMEVELAFENRLRVIPVLTDPEHLPRDRALPRSIRKIAGLQIAPMDLGHGFSGDIERLVSAVTHEHSQVRSWAS